MKVPRVVKAMEYIDDDLVSGAEVYKPKKEPFFHNKRWIVAAACLAIFAMVLGIFPLFGDKSESPFVLTAYAMDSDDGLTAVEMDQSGKPFVLSKIELGNGFDGFLFSVPALNAEDSSKITYLSSVEFTTPPDDALKGFIEENGLMYFYYIPVENEEMPVSFKACVASDGTELDYEICIEESESGYVAIQENASITTTGGVDGPQSVTTKSDADPRQFIDAEYPTYALIDSASFDIDDDGIPEDCTMSMGPTSGLFTVVITASVDGTIKYKNTFNLAYGELSFGGADGVNYFVRGEEYHRIFVDDNCIVIENLDPQYEGYFGGSDWNYNWK